MALSNLNSYSISNLIVFPPFEVKNKNALVIYFKNR